MSEVNKRTNTTSYKYYRTADFLDEVPAFAPASAHFNRDFLDHIPKVHDVELARLIEADLRVVRRLASEQFMPYRWELYANFGGRDGTEYWLGVRPAAAVLLALGMSFHPLVIAIVAGRDAIDAAQDAERKA